MKVANDVTELNANKLIVVLPDSGERYLTSILFEHLRQESLAMEAVVV